MSVYHTSVEKTSGEPWTLTSLVGENADTKRVEVLVFEASLITASRCGCLLNHLEVVCRDH
jgi:hypothetical protein